MNINFLSRRSLATVVVGLILVLSFGFALLFADHPMLRIFGVVILGFMFRTGLAWRRDWLRYTKFRNTILEVSRSGDLKSDINKLLPLVSQIHNQHVRDHCTTALTHARDLVADYRPGWLGEKVYSLTDRQVFELGVRQERMEQALKLYLSCEDSMFKDFHYQCMQLVVMATGFFSMQAKTGSFSQAGEELHEIMSKWEENKLSTFTPLKMESNHVSSMARYARRFKEALSKTEGETRSIITSVDGGDSVVN